MNALRRRRLVIIAASVPVFAGLNLGLNWLFLGSAFSIGLLTSFLVGGAAWAVLFWPMVLRTERRQRARAVGSSAGWGQLGTPETAALTLQRTLVGAREEVERALRRVPGGSKWRVDGTGRVIRAHVRMSRQSWGERITVVLEPAGPTCTHVRIESRAAFPLTLMDFGKNAANVACLVDELRP